MQTTIEQLLKMLPELANTDSGSLQLFIDDAYLKVIQDGFGVDNDYFEILHRYMTANLLAASNFIRGEITGESVGDVRLQYSDGRIAETQYANKWEMMYYRIKMQRQDQTGRLA